MHFKKPSNQYGYYAMAPLHSQADRSWRLCRIFPTLPPCSICSSPRCHLEDSTCGFSVGWGWLRLRPARLGAATRTKQWAGPSPMAHLHAVDFQPTAKQWAVQGDETSGPWLKLVGARQVPLQSRNWNRAVSEPGNRAKLGHFFETFKFVLSS